MQHILDPKDPITSFDYKLFSLPEQEVQIIAKEFLENDTALLDVKMRKDTAICPKCGSSNTKQVGKQYEKNIVHHLFLSNYFRLNLRLHKRRFECLDCKEKNKSDSSGSGSSGSGSGSGSTFLERFPFVNAKCTYTTIFRAFILREWEFQSLEELARKFHVSSTLMYDCIGEIDIDTLVTDKLKELEHLETIILGIDEFSFRGQSYMCQITEINTKKVVGILTTNSKQALETWLTHVPLHILKKIHGIASDMNASYKKTIQDWIRKKLKYETDIPEVYKHQELGIVDHFHLKQLILKAVMEVYHLNNWMIKAGHYDTHIKDLLTRETKETNKYRKEVPKDHPLYRHHLYTPNHIEYQAITLGHYLSCRYQDLLLLNSDKLTNKQQYRLNQILCEFDPRGYMKEIYCLKELFFEALDTKDSSLLLKAIHEMQTSLQYKIETCGKTLEKWKEAILNFFKTGASNAFTEGKNTKIKLLKRMAYGYRNRENFQKRLLLCL